MGRPERKLDPNAGPLQRFAVALRELRASAGRPGYRLLAKQAHFSVTTLSEAAGGAVVPSLEVTLAYVSACGGDQDAWTDRWNDLITELTRTGPTRQPDETSAPYLGMAAYAAVDAELFFGRERQVDQLRAMLETSRLVAVFAPSGAGKSSLLRAGLIPAITTSATTDGDDWVTVLLTPGPQPVRELALRLAGESTAEAAAFRQSLTTDPAAITAAIGRRCSGPAGPAKLLLVVDQFEEVFTLCPGERERTQFVALLLAAAEHPGTRVVLGVRADFYGQCAAHPQLVAALHGNQLLLGPVSDDDLRRIVTCPAARRGLTVEPALVEVIVADAGSRPGALPLMSHALLQTWQRRRDDQLALADYRAGGGVRGSIAQTAELVYHRLGRAQQHLLRDVLLRLTALGEGTEDTRRRATPAELVGCADPTAMTEVLGRLTAARLITLDRDGVTVTHEALIQEWPRLRTWLAEDRELLRAHRRLTEASAEWDRHGRDDGLLYRGELLAWWQEHQTERLNHVEHAFLGASRAGQQRRQRDRRRRYRLVSAGLSVILMLVGTLAALAWQQASQARVERDLAVSRQLTAQARNQLLFDPVKALRLAQQAVRTHPALDAEMVLRQAVADHLVRAVLPLRSGQALGVAFSPDGQHLAATGSQGEIRIWNWAGQAVTGNPTELTGHEGRVWSPVFSPDGRHLATAGHDTTVRIWPVAGGDPVVLRGHTQPVWAVAYSPDGRLLASAGEDTTVRLWNVDTGTELAVLRGHDRVTSGVAFSPNGRLLASSSHDCTVRLWNLADRSLVTVLTGPREGTKTLVFTQDGNHLASSSADGTAWVWPLDGSATTPLVLHGHAGTVEGLALSPDGRAIATSSDDSTVRVWSAQGAGSPLVLRGHTNRVWAVAYSPDGTRLASAADDGTVRIWAPSSDRTLLIGHEGAAWAAHYTPDGRRIVSGGADRSVRLWDGAGPEGSRIIGSHDDEVLGLDISPDGQRVATGSRDGTIRVWRLTGGAAPVVLRGHDGPAWVAAFSPDGQRLASAGRDGTLRIWDPTAHTAPIVHHVTDQIRFTAFSPDGRHVATAGGDGTVRIWDSTATTEPLVWHGHEGLVWAVAFSPDGQQVASSGVDGTVRIWPVTGGRPPLVLRGHQGSAWYVAFSPDGRWLATSGKDATLRLWRTTANAQPVTMTGFGASVESVEFSPDGTRLVTSHDDGTIQLWPCLPCAPVSQLLQIH